MEYRKTKLGVAICPFFIWKGEEDSGENDVELTFLYPSR